MNEKITQKSAENSEKMSERVAKIRKILANNNNIEFASRLGMTAQQASALCNGKGIGKRQQERILDSFPEVSRVWLLTGEGQMLNAEGDNANTIQVSDHSTNHGNITTIDDRLIAIIENDREKHHQERMELIAIIKNLTQQP